SSARAAPGWSALSLAYLPRRGGTCPTPARPVVSQRPRDGGTREPRRGGSRRPHFPGAAEGKDVRPPPKDLDGRSLFLLYVLMFFVPAGAPFGLALAGLRARRPARPPAAGARTAT